MWGGWRPIRFVEPQDQNPEAYSWSGWLAPFLGHTKSGFKPPLPTTSMLRQPRVPQVSPLWAFLSLYVTTRRPVINWKTSTTRAIRSRRWIKPQCVAVTIPSHIIKV
jgi:hypothetical protein